MIVGCLFELDFFNFYKKLVPKWIPKRPSVFLDVEKFWPPATLPEHLRGAGARFCIDLGSNFGTFFMPFGIVFGTRFVELEPAPPSNHGS